MGIGRAIGPLEFIEVRHTGGDVLFAVGGNVYVTDEAGLLDGLCTPVAGIDVVRDGSLREEVHRDHRELKTRTALDEDDFVIVSEVHEFADICLSLLMDGVIDFTAVRHFHYRHSRSVVIEHVGLGLFKTFDRKNRRTGAEIVDS